MDETNGNPDQAGAPQPARPIQDSAKTWAMACHLAGYAKYTAVPFANILAPLIIWILKKDEDPLIDDQGKEAINFQISVTLYALVCIPMFFCVVGVPAILVIGVWDAIMMVVAAVAANRGTAYRYPLTIRLIR